MRIAYFCAHYLMQRGGAELHVHRLAEELARRGHELTIYAAEGSLLPFPDAPYRVVALPCDAAKERRMKRWLSLENRRGGYRLAQWVFRSGYHRLLALGPWCPDLMDTALYKSYDVIAQIHSGSAWPVLMAKALSRLKGKLRVALPLLHVRESSASWPVLKKCYQPYDLLITNSAYEAKWMEEQGWGRDRYVPVGVGSDESAVRPHAGTFRETHEIPADAALVVFVGRKIYNKGVIHLIQAMADVWTRYPNAYLALIGFSYNPPEWIQGEIDRLPVAANGRILNFDDAPEQLREEALADADVFCMPSISDSFGIAYLDAWRYAKPVIGCRGTSSENIIDEGLDGLLVEFGDVRALGEAVLRLLGDASLRRRMGEVGQKKWKTHFRWETIAERTEELFLKGLKSMNENSRL